MNQVGGRDELEAEVDELHERLRLLEARLKGTFRGGREPGSRVEALMVSIGSLEAAFELDSIERVVPAAALQPIPEAPNWILGSLNLRGRTTPIVHIGARLQGGIPELRLEDLFVIAALEWGRVGLVVSEVGTIVDVTLDDRASLTSTPHADYVVGTFSHDGRTRLLLGIHELLRHRDLQSVVDEGQGV